MKTEAETRIELAACYRLAARHGWDELVSTHISARVPGSSDILLNPMGLMFDEVTASSLVRVCEDGSIADDPTGLGYNAGGFITHSQLHRGRADAECVVHLHPQAAVAMSCRPEGLLPITDDAALIVADLAYHDYEDGPKHLAEPEGLLHSFADRNYMLQRNHGAFTIGTSISQAWLRMYALTRACEVQIMAMAHDGAIDTVPAPSADPELTAKRNTKAARVGNLGWTALLRRLDREEPDYRD
ncbi:class II aldolase/adducin family protein [Sphingomonas sp. AOB5]|uniref:class II aldolase/adducin family protein n=1 Tax=Sphingomonas sp. AOB5 TaxID=3034017 RepID=UPI0023F6BD36|nr:class II aldolase/adducin family protein [Sphingomonas sp. AOB5]MDF7775559.1 class II aldolase/adducin family protein [Sphingomonas sp. AOB5]